MPKTKVESEAQPIPYKVSCGHDGCAWSARVELDAEPGPWVPPITTTTFEQQDDLSIVPVEVIVPWAGQPLEDAYAQHHAQVHEPQRQPPSVCWEKIG